MLAWVKLLLLEGGWELDGGMWVGVGGRKGWGWGRGVRVFIMGVDLFDVVGWGRGRLGMFVWVGLRLRKYKKPPWR